MIKPKKYTSLIGRIFVGIVFVGIFIINLTTIVNTDSVTGAFTLTNLKALAQTGEYQPGVGHPCSSTNPSRQTGEWVERAGETYSDSIWGYHNGYYADWLVSCTDYYEQFYCDYEGTQCGTCGSETGILGRDCAFVW